MLRMPTDLSFHLAPNAPWAILAAVTAVVVVLGVWAYRFVVPPLPLRARRLLPALRIVALAVLAWLLAQPALERAAGGPQHLVVLVDRSRSMSLPEAPGGRPRAERAAQAVEAVRRAWRGRAAVDVMGFATTLGDSGGSGAPAGGTTALGDALGALAASAAGQRANGVVVVSDGVVNAGADPVETARGLGVPVHAVVVGEGGAPDRAVASVEASPSARVGQLSPVRVRIATREPAGTRIPVRLLDEGRELARGVAVAPGNGADAELELRATPARPGLAVWTARVDSLPGEITGANNAHEVAFEVAPGRLGVVVVSGGLNWDLGFFRRALLGDSAVALASFVRERNAWHALERGHGGDPAAALHGAAVVVLDGITPAEVGDGFDAGVAAFVRNGGGLLAMGGPPPGVLRYRTGRLAGELGVNVASGVFGRSGTPLPMPEAAELLAWDDDGPRGERAWRAAAPLTDVSPLVAGGGDRVLLASTPGPPLLLARHAGRGQVLLVNGTGFWRWSLSGVDELAAERGRRLWRRVVHWLAEPAQGEPLRVRPERWLTPGGETVRLFATLQDQAFRPLASATVTGELAGPSGATRPITFAPRSAGSYVAEVRDLPPGRWRVRARATRGGRELGRAGAELAVDTWSFELARTAPDSAALAAVAAASGGRVTRAADAAAWAGSLGTRALGTSRSETVKLWQSPWLFAFVVGCLSVEWAWRRRRGLP
jgi:hypothetical protein